MAARTCETCRAIIGALIGVGAPSARLGDVEENDEARAAPTVPLDRFDARLQSLVNLKRAYQVEMPADADDPSTVERKKCIAIGMQMAIDHLCKATGVKVNDPLPPKTRKRMPNILNNSTKVGVEDPPVKTSALPKIGDGDGEIGKMAMALLKMAVAYKRPIPNEVLATLCGYAPTSGSVSTALADLRDAGLFEGNGNGNRVTAAGIDRAGKVQPVPSGSKLLAFWQSKLDGMSAKILGVIVEIATEHDRPITIDIIANATGYSSTSGSVATAMGKLRRLRLIARETNRPAAEIAS